MQISYRINIIFYVREMKIQPEVIKNLNPSSVMNDKNVDLAKLPKDLLGISLIPDIGNEPGHRIAVQGSEEEMEIVYTTPDHLTESMWRSQ